MKLQKKLSLLLSGAAFLLIIGYGAALQTKPTIAEVMRIENLAAKNECVGTLNRWSRSYRYRMAGWFPDFSQIEISFEQPGPRDVATEGSAIIGLHIYPNEFPNPFRPFSLDGPQRRQAYGTFDTHTGKISGWTCGCTWGVPDVPFEIECRKGGYLVRSKTPLNIGSKVIPADGQWHFVTSN